jgi:hypothetical protein
MTGKALALAASLTALAAPNIVAEDNVFREAYGIRNGLEVVYYLRSPIRVWHVNGATVLRGNVIEQAQQGIVLECRAGPQAGCDTGTTLLASNTIAGEVRDLGGTLQRVQQHRRRAGLRRAAGHDDDPGQRLRAAAGRDRPPQRRRLRRPGRAVRG